MLITKTNKLKIIAFFGVTASATIAVGMAPKLFSANLNTLDVSEEFVGVPELQRLRYFTEIDAISAIDQYNLSGAGVRVTLMGEIVDPRHLDLEGRIVNQFDTVSVPERVEQGVNHLGYLDGSLRQGDGHGTHIAGTIAAKADGVGIRGVASDATLDVYDFGVYEEDEAEDNIFDVFLSGFSRALRHVTMREKSKIVTGSFNLEAPALQSVVADSLMLRDIAQIGEVATIDEAFRTPALTNLSKEDYDLLKRFVEDHNNDLSIAAMALLPGTRAWSGLAQSVKEYQAAGGVYIVTESNYRFGSQTSALNALPTLSELVDPAQWLSVVMVVPKNLEEIIEKSDTLNQLNDALADADYETPINGCGTLARDYCISTPSYEILSTMTERVAERESTLLKIEGRIYQSYSGHSMGAPMVAATLALMEEYNRREKLQLSMRDLVRVLKQTANRDFKGYDPVYNGVGMLDVNAAITELARLADLPVKDRKIGDL